MKTSRAQSSAGTDAGPGPLHVREFRLFLLAATSSQIGNAVAPVALAFSVLHASQGNGVDLGIVLAARSLPLVVFLVLGGAVADRMSQRTVLVMSNLGGFVTQAAAAAILLSGHYTLTVIACTEFLNGLLTAFTQPAMRGILPRLLGIGQLTRANSLMSSARNAAMIVGPALSGLVVATASGGWAIAFDALTFLVAALFLLRLDLPGTVATRGSLLAEVLNGWQTFRSIRWACIDSTAIGVTNLVKVGVWSVLGPVLAAGSFGAAMWGVALSARAVGVLAMSLGMYWIAVRRLLAFGQIALGLGALPLLALGLTDSGWVVAAAALAAGTGSGAFGPAWEVSLQEHVPKDVLSRVTSLDDVISYVTVPLGMLAAAPLGHVFGNRAVALAGGVIFLMAAWTPLSVPGIRNLTHRIPSDVPEEACE